MKKAIWLLTGIALGVLASRRIARDATATELVGLFDGRLKAFATGIVDGFRDRDAELRAQSDTDTSAR